MLHQFRRALRRAILRPEASRAERGQAFYDKRYREKSQKRLPYHLSHYYPLWSVIADRLHDRQAVLDVGCGAGQLGALLIDQGMKHYTGFDLSPEAIDVARQHQPHGDYRIGNAFETDIYDTVSYDTIVCTEVLEHVDQDRELVERWPSGVRCVCSVPDFPAKAHVRHFDSAAAVMGRYADLFAGLQVTTHIRGTERFARFFLLDGTRL